MRTTRLLLCYDGSADAKVAIARAATTFGPRPAVIITVYEDEASGAARTRAAEGAKLAEAHGFAPVEQLAVRAPEAIWETVLDAATQFDTAVTVLGSRGRGSVGSALLGNVSDHVVHHATQPAFVVRHDVTESRSRRALIAYDGSDDAKLAIECAGRVLANGNVTVLAVWQHPTAALAQSGAGLMYATGLSELAEAAERAAHTCAAEGVGLATAAGLTAEPLVRQAAGPVWPTILKTADELDANVTVLGSRGLSGIKTLMLGSVSDAVLHHTQRPTLIVRHGARVDRGTETVTDSGQALR
jgi:nucleotide-binding universal stress UspA family protein